MGVNDSVGGNNFVRPTNYCPKMVAGNNMVMGLNIVKTCL